MLFISISMNKCSVMHKNALHSHFVVIQGTMFIVSTCSMHMHNLKKKINKNNIALK